MAITKVTEGARTLGTGEVTTANMATDPTNASNLSSGSVPTAQLGNVDTSGITANQDDIALLGFKVATNGSLGKYNLVDQTEDAFVDETGIDASSSTNELFNSTGYFEGGTLSQTVVTATGVGTWVSPPVVPSTSPVPILKLVHVPPLSALNSAVISVPTVAVPAPSV